MSKTGPLRGQGKAVTTGRERPKKGGATGSGRSRKGGEKAPGGGVAADRLVDARHPLQLRQRVAVQCDPFRQRVSDLGLPRPPRDSTGCELQKAETHVERPVDNLIGLLLPLLTRVPPPPAASRGQCTSGSCGSPTCVLAGASNTTLAGSQPFRSALASSSREAHSEKPHDLL